MNLLTTSWDITFMLFIPLTVSVLTPLGMKAINACHNRAVKKPNSKIDGAEFKVKCSSFAIGAMIFLVVFMTLATAAFPIYYLCDVPDGPPLEAAVAVACVFGVATIVAVVFLFAVKRWCIEVSSDNIKLVPLFGKAREYGWNDVSRVKRDEVYGRSEYRVYIKQQKKKAFTFTTIMVGGQFLADEFAKRGLVSFGTKIHI